MQFTSVLTTDYRKDLEGLLFFNPSQDRFRPEILHAIERCGPPAIVDRNGHLHVAVSKCPDAQNLHALKPDRQRPRLAGTIIYFRESVSNLLVVHVAVAPCHTMSQGRGEIPLFLQLLSKVVLAAQRVKGVETVEFLYGQGQPRRLPIAGALHWIAMLDPAAKAP